MILIVSILCLALSIVFGVAGVAKFLDLKGTREAVINFGVPEQFADAAKFLLPLFELVIAAGLLLPAGAWWSSLGALLLLILFIIAIAVNLKRGATHDCHCFGQLYSRPLGWPTLARNIAFALGAVGVLALGAPDVNRIANQVGVASAVLIAGEFAILAIVIVAAMLIQRQAAKSKPIAPLSRISRGLPVDSTAPPFDLPDYHGGRTSLSGLLSHGRPLMLMFSNPKCGPCAAVFLEVGNWQREHRDQLTIAILTQGGIKDNFVNVARNGLETVLFQQEREIADAYEATATPTTVIVRTDGTIATRLAAGADEIRAMLHNVLHHPIDKVAAAETSTVDSGYSGELQTEN